MKIEFTGCVSDTENGYLATKKIFRRADATIFKMPYDKGYQWKFHPVQDDDLAAFRNRLERLAQEPSAMIIMGAPKAGLDLRKMHRRLWAASAAYTTLEPVARWWLPIDCDDISVATEMSGPEELVEAGCWIRDTLLPEEFKGTSCIVCPTSSTGLTPRGVVRLRMFFAIDRMIDLADLRQWARAAQVAGLPVDAAVVQAGMPIYTSRPIFDGLADPVPRHLHATHVAGEREHVALVVDRFAAKAKIVAERVRAAERAAGNDWRGFLDSVVGGDSGFFEPLTRGLGVAARTNIPEDVIADYVAALLAERADSGRRARYDRDWVIDTITRFRAADSRTRSALAALRSDLFSPAGR